MLAEEKTRRLLVDDYPIVYNRVQKRKEMLYKYTGINLSADVLLLSNISGIYFPYLLDNNSIYKLAN